MVWSSQNLASFGSPNYSAYSSPNYSAYSSPNYAAYAAPNYAAYAAPNYAAYVAPNYAAYAAPNYAAYAAPNYAAYAAPNYAAFPVAPPPGMRPPPGGGGTGAGGASGSGFLGGYGPVARFEYATPAALGPIPWSLDFAAGDGWPPFPVDVRIDPRRVPEWQTSDWDPALRFWTLPFDARLTEWLQDLNLGAPAVMAAREFAARADEQWLARDEAEGKARTPMHAAFERETALLGWRDGNPGQVATEVIRSEIDELIDLMRDDRARYLDELLLQSGQAQPYFVHLMRFDPADKPWTMELMNCASSIGNLVKMQYKSHYRRVRPSTLCPGLVPPWGPPRHPSFPSGHSTVAHLTALLLLSVNGIAQRFGIFAKDHPGVGAAPTAAAMRASGYGIDQRSPLLWLAWRIAKGRERLGLHYSSDSTAGYRLATLVWEACGLGGAEAAAIEVPTLQHVLLRADSEWPRLPTA